MLELKLANFSSVPFCHGDLLPLLADYSRPNDKIAEWLKQGVSLHLSHCAERAKQSGDWQGGTLTSGVLKQLLLERIRSLDVAVAKQDAQPFVRDAKVLAIWSQAYFTALANKIVFVTAAP